MNNFFFKGLAYPRYSVSDMCEIALRNNFYPIYVSSEKPRYFKKILNFTKSINNFWPNIRKNYPRVSIHLYCFSQGEIEPRRSCPSEWQHCKFQHNYFWQ